MPAPGECFNPRGAGRASISVLRSGCLLKTCPNPNDNVTTLERGKLGMTVFFTSKQKMHGGETSSTNFNVFKTYQA